jgi:biopolymer transport protein ExbB
MWPLLALSLLSVAMSVERTIFWISTHSPGRRRWLRALGNHLSRGEEAQASALIARDGSVYGKAGLMILETPVSGSLAVEVAERFRPTLERFSTAHATIITASPLLGILGTVLGIIESFDLLGASENVTDISAVASGIAQALITTAFGLVVALITLFPHMFFRANVSRALSEIELLAASSARRVGAAK